MKDEFHMRAEVGNKTEMEISLLDTGLSLLFLQTVAFSPKIGKRVGGRVAG